MTAYHRLGLMLPVALITFLLWGQAPPKATFPQFHAPVQHTIKLSGTFAELRNSHFHGGIDIKSENGSWGDPVYAIDEGYVSRLSVAASGFGNALYISHPSGVTSVYAHLASFREDLQAYIRSKQEAERTFAINIRLTPDQFQIARGQFIGRMGSTGHSFGPHLHFEIRNSRTENLINPLRYRFDIQDTSPPVIKEVFLYALDHKLYNYRNETFSVQEMMHDTLEIDAWRVGLGLETYDPHNGGHNKNGIYGLKVFVDDVLCYAFNFDSLEWNQMNSFNTHIDYAAKKKYDQKIHKCYRLPTNELNIYKAEVSDGVIPIFRNRIQKVRTIVSDYAGNQNFLEFYLRQSESVSPPRYPTYHYHIVPGQADTIRNTNLEIFFPHNALFEDLYCVFQAQSDSSMSTFSLAYSIHKDLQALKNNVQIRIKPMNYAEHHKSKLLIARTQDQQIVNWHKSTWENDWLTTMVSDLGTYFITIDTVPPKITPVKNTVHANGDRIMVFKIEDDHSGSSIPLEYEAWLDDRWIFATYDLKSKQILCKISPSGLTKGAHHFKLLVKDTVDNGTSYDYRFSIK